MESKILRSSNKGPRCVCPSLTTERPVLVATFLIGQRPLKDRGYGLEISNCRGYRVTSVEEFTSTILFVQVKLC